MHIALNGWFWDRLDTGSGQYVQRLAEALSAADSDVALDVFVPSWGATSPPATPPSNLRLVSRTASNSQFGKLYWEQVLMPRWAHQAGADLLHIPYWAPPLRSRIPVVVTAHDIIPMILPAYRGSVRVRAYTALVSATTPRTRLVLTDSLASRRDILNHLRISPDHVRAIPLAVDEAYEPSPAAQDQQLRYEMGVSAPYILYIGGFDARKNVPVILQAFSIVHRACPNATLVIAGRLPAKDTAFTPDPKRCARDAALPDRAVQFTGFITEAQKLALYRGARVFIYPSAYEGFGYPPLEALACGVPVVASDTSSLPEVVGNAGVLLPPQDVEGMAGALIQILIDDAFHEALAQQALIQSRRFSWQLTAQATLDAYKEILQLA